MSWSPDDEKILRRALHDEASRVTPDPDALNRIQERTSRPPWWYRRVPWMLATATATAAATVAVGVALSTGGDPRTDVTAVTSEAESAPEPSEERSGEEQAEDGSDEERAEDGSGDERAEDGSGEEHTGTGGGDDAVVNAPSQENREGTPEDAPQSGGPRIVTVPAYYLADTPAGMRLAREFRGVQERGNAAETALAVTFAGPADPDYSTPWDPDTEFRVSTGDVIEVDLTLPDDGEPVPDEQGDLAIQQLVYTVQAALQSTDPVRILVDGEPADELWGVDVSGDLTRAPQLDVRQLVQINDPGEEVSVTSPVRVSGEAALFEAAYTWRVKQDGTVIDVGSGTAAAGQRFAAFSFEVELDPGEYEVAVSATDPAGGESPGPMSDSRAFTVTSSG